MEVIPVITLAMLEEIHAKPIRQMLNVLILLFWLNLTFVAPKDQAFVAADLYIFFDDITSNYPETIPFLAPTLYFSHYFMKKHFIHNMEINAVTCSYFCSHFIH